MQLKYIYINNYVHSIIVFLKQTLKQFNIPFTNIIIDGVCQITHNATFEIQNNDESFLCMHDKSTNSFVVFDISDSYSKHIPKWEMIDNTYPPKEFEKYYEYVKKTKLSDGIYIGKYIEIDERKLTLL